LSYENRLNWTEDCVGKTRLYRTEIANANTSMQERYVCFVSFIADGIRIRQKLSRRMDGHLMYTYLFPFSFLIVSFSICFVYNVSEFDGFGY